MQIVTTQGEALTVCALQADDGPRLVRFFHTLSPQTRWQRYGRTLQGISQLWVRRAVRAVLLRDPASQIVLLAFSMGGRRPQVVAEAQLVRERQGSDVAELGIAVADAYQHQGVGSQLLRLLVARGSAAGVRVVRAAMQADNAAMWRSLKRLELELHNEVHGGERFVTLMLTPER